jgi:hypothetical protein
MTESEQDLCYDRTQIRAYLENLNKEEREAIIRGAVGAVRRRVKGTLKEKAPDYVSDAIRILSDPRRPPIRLRGELRVLGLIIYKALHLYMSDVRQSNQRAENDHVGFEQYRAFVLAHGNGAFTGSFPERRWQKFQEVFDQLSEPDQELIRTPLEGDMFRIGKARVQIDNAAVAKKLGRSAQEVARSYERLRLYLRRATSTDDDDQDDT